MARRGPELIPHVHSIKDAVLWLGWDEMRGRGKDTGTGSVRGKMCDMCDPNNGGVCFEFFG